jgi:UDP-2,4-diacetamido-2,4,6-trideoxy-beta-L-altropyranose hydrolase
LELAVDTAAEPGELAARWPQGADLLVVDHYGRDANFERACRPWARRILVLDDLADRPHDCDMLLDPAASQCDADYAALVPPGCMLLLGPAYLPLRASFAAMRRPVLARRQREQKPRRLLLSFGATDPDNVTSAVLDILARAEWPFAVDILLGAAAPHLEAVRKSAAAASFPARLHVALKDVAGLLGDVDIAIGAGGGGAWERCCLGLPSIVICTAANQHATVEGLRTAGAAQVLEIRKNIANDHLIDALDRLIKDNAARRDMARAAACLCDGLGAQRVVTALDPPHAHDGTAIYMRPAVAADAERLLAWQRDPRTRRYSRTSRIPEASEHCVWFSARLGDPECLFNIIMHGAEPAGALRLEFCAEDSAYEISIYVAPERWRLGIGSAALDIARALLPEAKIRAHVHAVNEASHALFAAAGYRSEENWYVSQPTAELAPSHSAFRELR